MTRRKKPQNVFPVKSVEDANAVLKDIAYYKREIAAIESSMNSDIDKIKADAKTKAAAIEDKVKELESGLRAFSEYRKADLFKSRRSLSLNFGSFGFRRTTCLKPKPKTTWARVLGILKEKGFISAVRVKESPNKEVLAEWSDERLEEVAVRRVKKDQFWYEVDEEAIENGSP